MKNFIKILIIFLVIGVLAVLYMTVGKNTLQFSHNETVSQKTVQKHDLKKVKFGMLPYGDHSFAIIGASQGWFKEAGIDFEYSAIKVEEIVPQLKNGTQDVISCPPGILFSAYNNAPNLVSFVFGDLFQGYAILGQPDKHYLSYAEARYQGLSEDEAIKKVVHQFKGRTFAYPTEAAIKPFIDLVLEKGGVERSEIKSMVLDDPLTVNAMRKKDADFQVGGVPSRLVLEREGFIPLLSSSDLARMAAPSASSKELASILQNSWATTREFYENEHETILRIASVNYRIIDFINKNQEAALAIHMPYLSRISGQQFSIAEGKVMYSSLDPFISFEDQKEWFHNKNSPLYYEYVNGAILNTFISQNIFKGKVPDVKDIVVASDVYYELEKLKMQTKDLFAEIEKQGNGLKNSPYFLEAKRQYENYNFLDAEKLAKKALSSN